MGLEFEIQKKKCKKKPKMNTAEWLHEHLNPHNRESPIHLEKFGRKNLAKIYRLLDFKIGAEVGVADARHSELMCQQVPDLKLLCIDPWLRYRGNPRGGPQTQHDHNHELAKQRLASFDATLVKAMSMDAVKDVPIDSLDFVFIDGHHGFDWVMQDIIEWSRRVRKGGIVAGHDYYHFEWAGVVEAVDAYALAHHIPEWFVTLEREPTWFWARP